MKVYLFFITILFLSNQGCLKQSSIGAISSSETPPVVSEETPNEPPLEIPNDPPSGCINLDCNHCIVDVKKQFNEAAKKINWIQHSWSFNWPQSYLPNNIKPKDLFDGIEKEAHEFNIPDKHIQGFTRTNSSRFPYAGSHSHAAGTKGGVFVVENVNNKLVLASLHQSDSDHPSAVHIIGHELVYADKVGSKLVLIDLNSLNHAQKRMFTIPNPNFGGGLGIAKLSEGKHLVITTGPGSQKAGSRYNHFYELTDTGLVYLNKSQVLVPDNWDPKYQYSETLSVLTECGTEDIYTVHATGDEEGLSAVFGNGYWRLSKLDTVNGDLQLAAINKFKTSQSMTDCSVRASGMVVGNSNNEMEFYCHGYAKEPDGASIPFYGYVLGPPKDKNKDSDSFKFKKGSL